METDYTKTLIFISGYLYFILQCKKASLGVIQSYSSLLLQVRTRAMISRRLSSASHRLQSYLYWGGIAMKEQSSPVLRQPCRNNNIEGHPFSSVSTESMAWCMMHRERLGWCWSTAGRCDRHCLSMVLYLLALSYSETKLRGTHMAFSLPASTPLSLELRRAPRHFCNAKINTEFRAQHASAPT